MSTVEWAKYEKAKRTMSVSDLMRLADPAACNVLDMIDSKQVDPNDEALIAALYDKMEYENKRDGTNASANGDAMNKGTQS